MEYMTPNFTKDMVKTHKILIPNMAVTASAWHRKTGMRRSL